MQVLITGSAGFIGFHLAKVLCTEGFAVYGIDSLNHYYDVNLKYARLKECGIQTPEYGREYVSSLLPGYRFRQTDLCDKETFETIFKENRFDCIVHLAAQAGVRYSLSHPDTYIESNVVGFLNLLELCRKYGNKKLVYASSSSVYGNCQDVPFKESATTDHPVSLYAATKKSDELMAHTYSRLFGIETIGLRFFTVYGPWGRPDMAPILFAEAIRSGKTIKVFNNGNLSRDFTYIADIVAGISQIVKREELVREDLPGIPAVIYNIGHGSPVRLMDFIHLLELHMGREAQKEFVGMQPGDVYQTWADTTKLQEDYGYAPTTSLEAGIPEFVNWFNTFKYQS